MVGVHGLQHLDRLVDVVRQRLFAIHVLARPQGRQRDEGVPVVGRGDADRVDVLAVDDFAEIIVGRALAAAPGLLGVVVVDVLLGGVAAGGVHVADGQHLRVLPEEVAQQAPDCMPMPIKPIRRRELGLVWAA